MSADTMPPIQIHVLKAAFAYATAGATGAYALQQSIVSDDTLIPLGIFVAVLGLAVTATVKAVRAFDGITAKVSRIDTLETRLAKLERSIGHAEH